MKPNSRYAIFGGALGVIWLFLVTFNYYVVHKPFSVENAIALANVAGDLFAATILFAVAVALGRRLLVGLEFSSRLEAVVFNAAIGLGLVSFLTFAFGLAGLLNRLLFWVVMLVLGVALRSDLLATWRDIRLLIFPLTSRVDRILVALSAIALLIGLIFAIAPPIAWDSQTYHLVEAKTALSQGRITAPPNIVYFSFPSLVEMLFMAAMLLKSEIAAQLVHLGYLILLCGMLLSLGQRYLKPRTGIVAVALFLAIPSIMAVASAAYVDIALAFYTFAALYAAVCARDSRSLRWIGLSGALAGLAMGVKYTSAIVPIAVILVLLLNRTTRQWPSLFLFIAAAGLFASPWYLRNLAFMGNPVYPFVFGGPFWDSFRADWFGRFGTGLLSEPFRLLTAPWDATIMGREGGMGYEATIGPLLLGIGPLLLLTLPFASKQGNEPGIVREFALASAVLYVFWLVGIAESSLLIQTRLLFPAFPLLVVLAAIGLERLPILDLKQFSLSRFSQGVVLLVVGVTVLNYALAFASSGNLGYLVGKESKEAFLARNLGSYGAVVQFVNEKLPKSAHVLLLWEPRSYYIQRTAQPDAILDNWPHLQWKYQSADAIASYLRESGYTHVVLNRAGLDHLLEIGTDPLTTADLQTLEDLVNRHLTLVYGESEFAVSSNGSRQTASGYPQDAYLVYEIRGTGAH